MLKIVRSMSQLPFQQLMALYRESNLRSARENWSEYDPEYGLQMVERMCYEDLQQGLFSMPDACICLWLMEGEPVSCLRLEPWKDGILLTGLETAPGHRNQGHACELLQGVQAHLAQQGRVKLYSHIHHKNAPSIRVHTKCGFRRISDCARLLDGSVASYTGTYLYEK